MEEKLKKSTETRKVQLKENEIMRLSVEVVDEEKRDYQVILSCNGDKNIMKEVINQVCKSEFDMVCISKELFDYYNSIDSDEEYYDEPDYVDYEEEEDNLEESDEEDYA